MLFRSFRAHDSVTHADVAAQVEDAYQRVLRGDRSGEEVISEARFFRSARADALEAELHLFTSHDRSARELAELAKNEHAVDPAMLADMWPALVAAEFNPRNRYQGSLNMAIRNAPEPVAALLRSLADQYQRDGGLTADFGYAPAFAAAMDNARELARANREAEAFEVILAAVPSWEPLSPLHLVPMGLTWDRDLGRIMTHERRAQLLAVPRASGSVG